MSQVVNFWTCDGCEGEGRLWPAEWKVQGPFGMLNLCDRHVNAEDIDPSHSLRIGAILANVIGSQPTSSEQDRWTCNCPESGTSGSCPFHDARTGLQP